MAWQNVSPPSHRPRSTQYYWSRQQAQQPKYAGGEASPFRRATFHYPSVASSTMGVFDKSRVLMQRLEPKHRTLHTSKTRTDIHLQQKKSRIYNKLTTAERKAQNERREKKRELLNARLKSCDAVVWKLAEDTAAEFGYDAYHWYHHILQNARMAKKQRKANRWNAFVAMFLEPINAGMRVQ